MNLKQFVFLDVRNLIFWTQKGGDTKAFGVVCVLTMVLLTAVHAAVEAPSKATLAKRAYDASPKDAPLRSLFPDEPAPPKPVSPMSTIFSSISMHLYGTSGLRGV